MSRTASRVEELPRVNGLIRSWSRFGLLFARPFLLRRVGRHVVEFIDGVPFLVLPDVFNPAVFRSSAFLAGTLSGFAPAGAEAPCALDMGTGSGVGAVFAARHGYRVVGVDLNPEAVRCARINALLNRVEDMVEVVQGDLFAPLAGRRFDLVLFNPPFFRGEPKGRRDLAWRGTDVMERFASGLPSALNPAGRALVVLSTDGDAAGMVGAFKREGLAVEVVARRNFGNEIMTVYGVRHPEVGGT